MKAFIPASSSIALRDSPADQHLVKMMKQVHGLQQGVMRKKSIVSELKLCERSTLESVRSTERLKQQSFHRLCDLQARFQKRILRSIIVI